jgi:hypothetical protein
MYGAVPSFPHTSSWPGPYARIFELKHIVNTLTKIEFYTMCLWFCFTESGKFYHCFILLLAL